MALTVGELRAKLAALPDEYEVVIGDSVMQSSATYLVQRIDETSLERFEPRGPHRGKAFYLDSKDAPNALCLWA